MISTIGNDDVYLFATQMGLQQIRKLRVNINIEVMGMKEYSTFSKDLGLEPHHQIVKRHIQNTRWLGNHTP